MKLQKPFNAISIVNEQRGDDGELWTVIGAIATHESFKVDVWRTGANDPCDEDQFGIKIHKLEIVTTARRDPRSFVTITFQTIGYLPAGIKHGVYTVNFNNLGLSVDELPPEMFA